jgi:hypothetical protein
MKKKQLLEKSQELINSKTFKERHRASEKYFTRARKLCFSVLIILIIRKSVKSMQLILNELSIELDTEPVTAAAFTKARAKLKHTAFIELNREAVVGVCYGDGDYKRYKGFRVLGIDGSKLLLPDTTDVIKEFGQISYRWDKNLPKGQHAYGIASVMYDVLNHVAVDSVLGQARSYEVDLAMKHLEYTQENDLLLCDREYPSYRFLSTLVQSNRQFVIRCSAKSFSAARTMLKGKGTDSQIVTLKPHHSRLKEIKALGLPLEITVRFVRVILNTGEYEVLVTSLIDENIWPTTEEFKEIYWLRWGTEGFYSILSTRLNLENFTGQTAESVYQDFYATVYLTGMESILTADANIELAKKPVCYPQQVNHIVSFNAIKNQAFDILFGEGDTDSILKKLHKLFLMNPTCRREDRKIPRQKNSSRKLLDYWKRRRKHCF